MLEHAAFLCMRVLLAISKVVGERGASSNTQGGADS